MSVSAASARLQAPPTRRRLGQTQAGRQSASVLEPGCYLSSGGVATWSFSCRMFFSM